MPPGARPALAHVVWDWNGTLFDDFGLTARIAERTFASMGLPGVTADGIRAAFCRPFGEFYATLFGRPVSADEFAFIRERYEAEYEHELDDISLQPDAHAAMDLVAAHASQSLLSMAHDRQLQALVDRHDIRGRFVLVEGSPGIDSDGSKTTRMARHLEVIGARRAGTVVIGDTVDDHEAATANGARSVLVTTGSTSRPLLEATGAPVVDTLAEAAAIALRLIR